MAMQHSFVLTALHYLHHLDLVLDGSRYFLALALFQSQELASVFGFGKIDTHVLLRLGTAKELLDTGRGHPLEQHVPDVSVCCIILY